VAPIYWYHQHFNLGRKPARYLAINAPRLIGNLGLRFQDQLEGDISEIHHEFEQEVAQSSHQVQGSSS
jgi:hypothetical protein